MEDVAWVVAVVSVVASMYDVVEADSATNSNAHVSSNKNFPAFIVGNLRRRLRFEMDLFKLPLMI